MTACKRAAIALLAGLAHVASAQIAPMRPVWLPAEYSYDAPFVPGAVHDPAIPTATALVGFDLGVRPMRHAEVLRCFEAWDAASQRMTLLRIGRTHEQREQIVAVITSEANHARLEAIRGAIGKLADPRRLKDAAEADAIIRDTPAIAWMAYCIHGDEMSGTDAGVALAYHLVASKDKDTTELLDHTVICIDPIQNPDGRDRFITMLDETNGYTPVLDRLSDQHEGHWPRGRTNHYLFDLNRDWIYAVHPETRHRQRAISEWTPQLLIDGHEMGPEDTFLFNPAREPFNPGLSPLIRKWWKTFADDAGAAFDRHGWSYYTREWADFWYPGYSDGWATLHGAIGILYEQARTGGRPVLLPTGRVLTYREAVHHQLTVSTANLSSLLRNRAEILRDYLAQRRAALAPDASLPQTFLMPPSANATRQREFVAYLRNQGIEVAVTTAPLTATNLTGSMRENVESREFPAGTIVVQRAQPLGPLVGAVLDFDPRMDKEFLDSERRELETKRQSRLYDITGWSPVMAWALEAYWSPARIDAPTKAYEAPAMQPASGPRQDAPVYAYVIDVADDSWRAALASLLMAGVQVRVADEEFRAAGRTFARGSLLIRRHDNAADVGQVVSAAAGAAGAVVHVATTARSPDDAPDLGGQHMILLARPSVALLGGADVDGAIFGATWHLLDKEVGLPVSIFQLADAGRLDLRRYNVLIVPGLDGGGRDRMRGMKDDIAAWLRSGGTLVALDSAAGFFADSEVGLSAVRSRESVIKEKQLDEYASAVALERAAGTSEVEMNLLWDDTTEVVPAGAAADKPETKLSDEALDEWRRLFSPTGAILRAELRTTHWLTFGCGSQLPTFAAGSRVLLAKGPVETPVRFTTPKHLRLSGLLWPESASRLADSAAATVERVGSGQLILFAQDPNFRGAYRGSSQLLLNAILLGPGCGTNQPAR